jgi:hypothetical protein
VSFEPGESSIDEDGAESGAKTGGETLQTDLNGVRVEDGAELRGEEVQQGVKVHAFLDRT